MTATFLTPSGRHPTTHRPMRSDFRDSSLSLPWLFVALATVGLLAFAVAGGDSTQASTGQVGDPHHTRAAESPASAMPQTFDGRGKWTGSTR